METAYRELSSGRNLLALPVVLPGQEKTMKKTIAILILLLPLILSACATQTAPAPTSLPATATEAPTATHTPIPPTPTQVEPTPALAHYTNSAFRLSFEYPSSWYGPDEYIADQTLRVEVGSDVVYPYGTGREEQIYTLPNSYYVVIQYTQNDQNQVWADTLQALAGLQDGESLSDMRSLTIRVRQLDLGRFTGFEYIATLSETAQTEAFYARSVILIDPQTNDLLTIMGSPNNVDLSTGQDWRQTYQAIDEANLPIFQHILASLTIP
jgi:hypothetical protein